MKPPQSSMSPSSGGTLSADDRSEENSSLQAPTISLPMAVAPSAVLGKNLPPIPSPTHGPEQVRSCAEQKIPKICLKLLLALPVEGWWISFLSGQLRRPPDGSAAGTKMAGCYLGNKLQNERKTFMKDPTPSTTTIPIIREELGCSKSPFSLHFGACSHNMPSNEDLIPVKP